MREARDGSGSMLSQYFPLGQTIGGASYFFIRDHLGSVRELTNSGGVTSAQYDYDAYGRTVKIQGAQTSDFQYGGYYWHSASQLGLTLKRQYSSTLGRWLSRDPASEGGGINVYAYVFDAPIAANDPSGLFPQAPGTGKCRQCMNCAEIASKITNNVAELSKRHAELLNDKNNLPALGSSGSIASHVQKYNEIQGYLNDCIAMYVAKGCNTPLPPDTEDWRFEPASSPAPPAWDPRVPSQPVSGPPNWAYVLGGLLLFPYPGNPIYLGL